MSSIVDLVKDFEKIMHALDHRRNLVCTGPGTGLAGA
jgi:hypothetical protein